MAELCLHGCLWLPPFSFLTLFLPASSFCLLSFPAVDVRQGCDISAYSAGPRAFALSLHLCCYLFTIFSSLSWV